MKETIITFILLLIINSSYQCDLTSCPYNRGKCLYGQCICHKEYISLVNSQTYCSYSKKKQTIFLYLEALGLIGFGHIYARRFLFGITKFILLWMYSIFSVQFTIIFLNLPVDLKETKQFKVLLSTILILIPLFLHALDMYFIAFGYYVDGNGYEIIYNV